MLITITEFAEQRNTDRDTVNAYIRKHPEIKKYVMKTGKNVAIDTDTEAFQLLNKQYPLPQMVQIIEDTESRQKLIKAHEMIIQLQKQLNEQSLLIAKAEASQMLLEDKTTQLERVQKELVETKDKLEEEMKKSWVKKLFGR